MSDTSTTDKIVVGGALVGSLLFFGFLTNTCTSPFSMGDKDTGNDETITTPAVIPGTPAKTDPRVAHVAKLQEQIAALKLKNANLSELKKDNDALRKEIVNNTKSYDDTKDRLNKKIELFRNEVKEREALVITLKKKLAAMSADTANTAEASAKVTSLEGTIKDLKSKNVTLTTNLDKLDAQLKMANADMQDNAASGDKFKQLSDNLAAKNAELIKLDAQVNQFKAQKTIFAKSTDDLPKSAQTLFADLKNLEGQSADEINKAYGQLSSKNNSEAKARIKFSSASSDLTAGDKAKIAALTQTAGDNSYFLIVGYADKTGSATDNEKLSSARSTSVAKELVSKAKGFQAAQAVYLGQTDRFGPSDENRVVEIWEIK